MWVAVANPSLASPNSPDPALHPVPSRGDPTRPGFSAVCRGCGVSQRLAGSDSPPPQCRSLRRVIGDTSSVSGPDRQPPHSGAGRPLPETRPQNRTLPPAHEPLGPAFSSAVRPHSVGPCLYDVYESRTCAGITATITIPALQTVVNAVT